MMSRKRIPFGVAFFVLFVCSAILVSQAFAQTVSTGSTSLTIHAVDAHELVRGQEEASGRKGPGLFERMRRSIANWAKDDEFEKTDEKPVHNPQGKTRPVTESSVPTTPPKPVTANDIRNSNNPPEIKVAERERSTPATERRLTNTPPSVATPTPSPAAETESARTSGESEDSIHRRLRELRKPVFDDLPEERNTITESYLSDPAPPARQPSTPRRVAVEPAPKPIREYDPAPMSIAEHTALMSEERAPEEPSARQTRSTTIARPGATRTPERNNAGYWDNDEVVVADRRTANVENTKPHEEFPPISGIAVPSESPWNHPAPGTMSVGARTTRQPSRITAGQQPVGVLETQDLYGERPSASQTGRETKAPQAMQPKTPESAPMVAAAPVDRERAFLASPRIEVETEGDSRVIVGQESTYRVRMRNRGGAPAEQVALTVEVPNWIEVLPPDVSTGTTSISPKNQNQDSRQFVWKISRLESMAEEQLVLHLVPEERKTVDLRIRYDFYKPSVVAKITVEEPVLEMELQGPSEVLWGTKVGYKLFVRNTGNGDAEKVRLELLQTGSDMKSCDLPSLKAGEEQMIDVDVWTGKQEHIDINILATGSYELTAKAFKRVKVLRPEVTINVESAEMQFVDAPAEFLITVTNEGSAPATNLDLTATVPLGARYVSNTGAGRATPQNQVLWNIPSIQVGEKFVVSVLCEPKREGLCKLEATVNDRNGEIASCSGAFHAEAIADLKMQVENPQGPIEVGQEAVFTIQIVNRGTKTAEDVEVIAAFARGLEPFAIEGANGVMNDGQVVFDKIPSISAGQTVTLKVKGRADRPGNHRMRTEVVCLGVNTHLVFEQATYFYQKSKGKASALASEKNNRVEITPPPTTLNAIRDGAEPQPLRNAPTTAVKIDVDPFLR